MTLTRPIYITRIVIFIAVLPLLSCKKGEDDPILSLKSRKTRVAGNWVMEEGSVLITTVNFSAATRDNSVFELRKSAFTLNETSIYGVQSYVGPYSLKLVCDKAGNFTLWETLDKEKLQVEGEWNFNKRSGDKKNREYLQMAIKKVMAGRTSGYFLFNQSSNNFQYRLLELRDKKMVLEIETSVYVDANGEEQTFSGKYTFVPL